MIMQHVSELQILQVASYTPNSQLKHVDKLD